MSLGSRATKGGAKGAGAGAGGAKDKLHEKKSDKPQPKEKVKPQEKAKTDKPHAKEKVKPQATTEQLRMANMIDRKNEDASDVRRMVLELMEMTCRTEEEVCSALHDSDNDMVAACNLLLEDTPRQQGEWQTSEKKKKKPPVVVGNGDADPPRDPRSRSGPRPRRGEADGRGRASARGRGSRGAVRGGRGGRRGGPPRPRPSRAENWDDPTDTGGNTGVDSFPQAEDWDNEEWSGSLEDTKVFTPSAAVQNNANGEPANIISQEDWDIPESTNDGPTDHIPTYIYNSTQHAPPHPYKLLDQLNNSGHHPAAATAAPPAAPEQTYHHQHQVQISQPMGMSGSLTAAQSQYLSQLTQQSQRHDSPVYQAPTTVYQAPTTAYQVPTTAYQVPTTVYQTPTTVYQTPTTVYQTPTTVYQAPTTVYQAPTTVYQTPATAYQAPTTVYQAPTTVYQAPTTYSSNYSTSNYGVYGDSTAQRKPQRARVPPPSKIPSSAVEMPGGADASGAMFLDVQFGALEPETLNDPPPAPSKQVVPQPEPAPAPAPAKVHEPEQTNNIPQQTYSNSMLNDNSMSTVEATAPSQQSSQHQAPIQGNETIVTNNSALEKQLTASMKQLAVSVSEPTVPTAQPTLPQHQYTQRPKPATVGQQNVYAHHAVTHHPAAVYGASVYAPQVNSTNASLTNPTPMSGYPSSVTLTQYQPMMNSYQQTSSSATVYGGSALYTHAPYTAYQPTPQPKSQTKDTSQQQQASQQQYDNSVSTTSSLSTATTTQQSTTKSSSTTLVPSSTGVTVPSASAGYAAGALYGGTSATYAAYDEAQMMRNSMPHHMQGYYEVGYGVSGAREGTFGLGAGERFGRTDAASPQQVPAAALPPGYAYFYQPPPTTYQYGVYPTYGGGSNVGGVGGVGGVTGVTGAAGGKLGTYPQQPYDAQDSYKPGGPYNAGATKSAGGAATDLSGAMYAKAHVALNKVNSYEKAGFHSGTPPPFGAGSHLYIPAPPHHHPHHHAPQHQQESQGGGRSAATKPPASKPAYSQSYWAPN